MARSESKRFKQQPLIVGTNILEPLDVTNYTGVSVSIQNLPATVGSMTLQASNDQTNWTDISSSTTALTASGLDIINFPNLHVCHVRVKVVLAAGAGNYDLIMVAKER